MYKDNKMKRAELRCMMARELRYETRADPRALEKFRAKPYQLQYAERLKRIHKRGGEETD